MDTVIHMFEETLSVQPSKKAIFCGSEAISFEDLHRQATATAHALRNMGVKPGDRVGMCSSKTIEQVITILGVKYARAILVPIHSVFNHTQILHIVNDCEMSVLVVEATRAKALQESNSTVKILLDRESNQHGFTSLAELRRQAEKTAVCNECAPSATAAIIYSSGSTGSPKGIVISHQNLADGARIVASYLGTTHRDRIAGVLSHNSDYGLNQLWQVLLTGASLHLHDYAFSNDFLAQIERDRLTILPLMPVLVSKIFNRRLYSPNPSLDLTCVRRISTTGGAVSSSMISNLQRVFASAKIYIMYGLTEAFRSTYLTPEELGRRPGSIGKAIPGVEIHVLDKHGESCPPGVPGELVHRGACITQGYWNAPEETSRRYRRVSRFPSEIVVFSGDLVKTDEEGFLYYLGRMDSMIKTHGFRVSPTEVEDQACQHEGVNAAVVFGVRNPEIGDDIVLVYTSDQSRPVSEKEIQRYLATTLPPHMSPRWALRVDQFPTLGGGSKYDRVEITERAKERLF